MTQIAGIIIEDRDIEEDVWEFERDIDLEGFALEPTVGWMEPEEVK